MSKTRHPPVYQPPLKRLKKNAPTIALAFWGIFFLAAGLLLAMSNNNALF
jgi:hypothetical protein